MLTAMNATCVLLVALCALCCVPSGVADAAPAVGERIAPLRLPTIDGETVALRDFRGKKLLLIEFASW